MRLKLPSAEQMLLLANLLAGRLLFRQRLRADFDSILVVKWDEIGDMATSTHVFSLLRKAYPDAVLTVLCKPFVKPLIAADPHIDHILTDFSQWNQKYGLIVDLRGNLSSLLRALRYRPLCRLSRATVRWKHRGHQLHETLTNFEIIQPVLPPGTGPSAPQLYFSRADEAAVKHFLGEAGLERFVLMHAGARKKLRQWNPERFAATAEYLKNRYGLDTVMIGSQDESDDVEYIRSLIPFKTHAAMGNFSLSMLSCLCSRAAFYIGNESGPMHIAAAFGIPMIGLFGPGVPRVFYPVHPGSVVLHKVLPCNPCDQIHCVHPGSPCISRIELAEVLSSADRLLAH